MIFSPLGEDDREAIEAAVRAAEAGTRGEIVVVVARRASAYRSVPLLFALLGALLVPLPLLWLTQMSGERLYLAQVLTALGLVLALSWPGHRLWLVPRFVMRARAREAAAREFLARGLTGTKERTGVLIFVALAERYAEVRCDSGLASVVDEAVWRETVDALTARIAAGALKNGLLDAVARAGRILAEAAPVGAGDTDELPNRVILT